LQRGIDAALVKAAQTRDASAFGRLYEHCRDPVFRYGLSRTGAKHEAEDLVADVFIRAMEASRSRTTPRQSRQPASRRRSSGQTAPATGSRRGVQSSWSASRPPLRSASSRSRAAASPLDRVGRQSAVTDHLRHPECDPNNAQQRRDPS
jgi:hypothetical protein